MDLRAVDVVGLSSGEGTRSCTTHAICGDIIAENDVLLFKAAMLDRDDKPDEVEEVLKVYRLVGTETRCHVGFLPSRLINH